jgi:hypothetical protein
MTGMDLPRSCGWKRSSSRCRGTTRSWSRSTQRQSAGQTARFVARSRSSLGRSTVPSVSKPTWSASRTQLRKKLRFSQTASRSASTPRPSSVSSSATRCSVLSARWVTVVSSVIRIGSAVSKRKLLNRRPAPAAHLLQIAPNQSAASSIPAEFRADHPDANGCGDRPPDQRESIQKASHDAVTGLLERRRRVRAGEHCGAGAGRACHDRNDRIYLHLADEWLAS